MTVQTMRTFILLCLIARTVSAFAQCGVERTDVKDLKDPHGLDVLTSRVKTATVAQLTSLAGHTKKELLKDGDKRIAPVETAVYEVSAVVVGFKRETDQDFHACAGGNLDDHRVAQILRIGDDDIVSTERQTYGELQQQFDSDFGHVTAAFKKLPKPVPVTVRGVGFFDFVHGQTGAAKNGFELHPVLSMEKAQMNRRKK